MSEPIDSYFGPLTKEQKRYIELKQATDSMCQVYKELRRGDKIPYCIPRYEGDTVAVLTVEQQYYMFLECLEGKHNEFLKHIIDTYPKN